MDNQIRVFNDNVYKSLGGISLVESWGDVVKQWEFSTGGMDSDLRDDFMDFLDVTCVGRKESFTYSDRYENTSIVRIIEDSVTFVNNGPLYWIAKLTLEVQITS